MRRTTLSFRSYGHMTREEQELVRSYTDNESIVAVAIWRGDNEGADKNFDQLRDLLDYSRQVLNIWREPR